jgi:endonuclease III related protein
VMVGAILTQSASWTNVEKAIANLKAAGVLSPEALREISLPELAVLVHPSGYFNVKARKLKALVEWLGARYRDDIALMSTSDTVQLRQELLGVWGIGEETADSIILYAAEQPVFVIDAYTKRIFDCLGLKPATNTYSAYQALFMENLPTDIKLYNEYHALLVAHGKNVCRKKPLCGKCCLSRICRSSGKLS